MTLEELQQENLQLRDQIQNLQTANANLTATSDQQNWHGCTPVQQHRWWAGVHRL